MPQVYKTVELRLVDPPAEPIRTVIDQAGIESLAANIRECGLIEPIVVKSVKKGRYEVIAGHRRLLACRLAGLVEVPVIVRSDAELNDAVKHAENAEREEMNVADEAVWLAGLYMEKGEDIDAVCTIVKKSRDYVERRVALVGGDDAVMQALKVGRMPFGVAEELNKIADPTMRNYYMTCALSSGCTVAQMRRWRVEANTRGELEAAEIERQRAAGIEPPPPDTGAPVGPKYGSIAQPYEMTGDQGESPCKGCGQVHQRWQMYKFHVCKGCADAFAADLIARGV